MADAKSLLHQDLVWTLTIPPARRLVWRAYGRLHVLRTMEGARVSIVLATKARTKVILVFSLVASLGKYTFRIQNS